LPAEIPVYSSPSVVSHPDNRIVFVVTKVHIPPRPVLYDALCMYPIPGDPRSPDYEESIPKVLYPYVYGVGTTVGKAVTLAGG
ncbi:hypothetical protein LXA43DRAFT_870760, partial [Ganoderma leucocontextum]